MAKTQIEWATDVWNPIRGCSMAPGSETGGCLNCYAAKEAIRHAGVGGAYEGLARMTDSGPRWTGKVAFIEEKLKEPLRWRKPRRVFVNSMSDLFHESVDDQWIWWILGVMALCQRHTFQILTKRPERMYEFFSTVAHGSRTELFVHSLFDHFGAEPTCDAGWAMPLRNVWLGVSVENQTTADQRIPMLLKTRAAVRWVSYEPALGPVKFGRWLERGWEIPPTMSGDGPERRGPRVDWVVCGGESGPGARPMDPKWARSARDECQAAGVPYFFKQWGEWLPENQASTEKQSNFVKGWQDVRPYDVSVKIGKSAAGRLLDGREWSEYPHAQTL